MSSDDEEDLRLKRKLNKLEREDILLELQQRKKDKKKQCEGQACVPVGSPPQPPSCPSTRHPALLSRCGTSASAAGALTARAALAGRTNAPPAAAAEPEPTACFMQRNENPVQPPAHLHPATRAGSIAAARAGPGAAAAAAHQSGLQEVAAAVPMMPGACADREAAMPNELADLWGDMERTRDRETWVAHVIAVRDFYAAHQKPPSKKRSAHAQERRLGSWLGQTHRTVQRLRCPKERQWRLHTLRTLPFMQERLARRQLRAVRALRSESCLLCAGSWLILCASKDHA